MEWYSLVALDLNTPIDALLAQRMVCLDWRRKAFDKEEMKSEVYGILFQAYDLYRACEPPLALGTIQGVTLRYRRGFDLDSDYVLLFCSLTLFTVFDGKGSS